MKKYEFTGEVKTYLGKTLHRIKSVVSFGIVVKGEIGGWIESEKNLSQDGNAWVSGNAEVSGNARVCGNAEVYGNARVYGNAWVSGNAEVSGNAKVCGNAHFMVIGAIGSRFDFTTFFRNKENGISVKCGCFYGTIAEFRAKVTETHGTDTKFAKVYQAAADLAEMQIELKK